MFPPVVDNQLTKWAIRNGDDYESFTAKRAADCASVYSLWMPSFSPRSWTFKWDRGWTSRELHWVYRKAWCSHDIWGEMEFRKRNYDSFWRLDLNSNISQRFNDMKVSCIVCYRKFLKNILYINNCLKFDLFWIGERIRNDRIIYPPLKCNHCTWVYCKAWCFLKNSWIK